MNRKEEREILEGKNFFATFIIIKEHFFKELNHQLVKVKDTRQAKKVISLAFLINIVGKLFIEKLDDIKQS